MWTDSLQVLRFAYARWRGAGGLHGSQCKTPEMEPVVHVRNDVGVLRVSQKALTMEGVFASGVWKTPGNRPGIWEVI